MARTTRAGDGTPAQVAGRVLPHDLNVEKAVLSGLMLDNRAIHTVLTELKSADFYHPSHQKLFNAMIALQNENEPVDLHTLAEYLNTRKELDAIGGPVFLAEIADYEATAANVLQHARIELGMVRYSPADLERVTVDAATRRLYLGEEDEAAAPAGPYRPSPSEGTSWAKAWAERLKIYKATPADRYQGKELSSATVVPEP